RGLHQRPVTRDAAAVHDRQRDPVEVPGVDRLPPGGGALVRPDGGDPGGRARVRAVARQREADRMTATAHALAPPPQAAPLARIGALVRRHVLAAYAAVALLYLVLPTGAAVAVPLD